MVDLGVEPEEDLLLAGVQGRVLASIVDAADRGEVDSLDIVQALEALDSRAQVLISQRVTEVHEDEASCWLLFVKSLEELVANPDSSFTSGHGVDGEQESLVEAQDVKEHLGLDGQLGEGEDKALSR